MGAAESTEGVAADPFEDHRISPAITSPTCAHARIKTVHVLACRLLGDDYSFVDRMLPLPAPIHHRWVVLETEDHQLISIQIWRGGGIYYAYHDTWQSAENKGRACAGQGEKTKVWCFCKKDIPEGREVTVEEAVELFKRHLSADYSMLGNNCQMISAEIMRLLTEE